jgi:N-acetyl-alpha-D-glucosaminyl L-malate synthase BshA
MEKLSSSIDKLRIGITCYPSLGGSGVVATELGKLLAERGHEVHFITQSMPFRLGKFNKNIFYHEVEASNYYTFKYPPYDLFLASKQAEIAETKKLDLLHVHYAIPHAICALLAKKMLGDSLKIVTTLHGTDISVLAHDLSLAKLIRYAINESDAVTAVSRNLIDETIKLLHIEREIELTYNFIDKRVYYPRDVQDLRSELAEPDEKILMHISNFRPVKRVSDVIQIFDLVQQNIKAKLILVGEGPELSKVRADVEQLGLSDRVIFYGRQDDVARIVSVADVLLLPSEKESFGLVALEAMACGVPTIASNTGGIPELIIHGETGFTADVGNVEQMAAYALDILTQPEVHRKLADACVKRANEHFNNEKITLQYEEIYNRVVSNYSKTEFVI